MHEVGIAEAFLQAALEVAEAHDRRPVERIHVHLGRLRKIVPEALLFAFDTLTKGTLAQGAALTWEEIAPQVRCSRCDTVFQPEDEQFWPCPICRATTRGEVLAGEDLLLAQVILHED